MYTMTVHYVEKLEIVDSTQGADYVEKGFIFVKKLQVHTREGLVELTLFSDDLAKVTYSDERKHSELDGVHAAVAVGEEQ